MCDEARSFKEEQMALCVRYTNHFQIFERFLGFINVSENQNSESLTSAIVCFLGKYNLIDVPIIAQSYDGASVMSGKHGGVQKKIQEKYPYAIYTHCMAHRTNLVVIDMCKSVNEAKSLFNTLEAVYVHFAMPTTNYKFLEIKNKLKIKNKSITRISDTRWSCRYHNCKVIMENYPALIEVLNEEIEDNNDRDVAQAKGILSLLQEPGFVVHLFVLYEILLVVNILSNRLQEKTATLGQAAQIIHSVIQSLKDYRNDDKFLVIWNQINEFAKKHQVSIEKPTIGLGSKRRRVESTRLSNFYVTSTTSAQQEVSAQVTNEAFWRIKYYAVLDSVIENLIRRFSDQSLELAQSVDNFFLLDFKESKLFINHYKDLFQIDTDTLMAEMTVAKNAFQTVYQDQVLGDPEQMKSIINEATFPNLYKLLGVAYTLPISSATCERSFSAMRRVKTWLRSTMIQERFSNLSIIHIERDISNNINSEDILNDFSSANNRKIPLIY
ncbi:52 kDa repressor of the inhibitor of the protein kinase-like [Acyrthosiphon pisum]|uniref:Zinc finger MYM-type protein 1-like n=1 Tax=Acyrthosiphon pisum TaxID=7029 RepID=A0A8R2JR43_ACYPI|nr:52 kDa repressor of the inhibitor of the protein kinase-like [Acyrthosiphon pisum]